MTGRARLRGALSTRALVAGGAIAGTGLVAVLLASALMAPNETTLLQAAVSARDYDAANAHNAVERGATAPGGFMLAIRALLGSGRTDAALARIETQLAATPGDLALRRTRATLLGRLGRVAEQEQELDRIARRTGRLTDIRALSAVAAARGDGAVERTMLGALVAAGRATGGELERLAILEADAGDAHAAWPRFAALVDRGASVSPAAAGRIAYLAQTEALPERRDGVLARLRRAGHKLPDDATLVARLRADGRPDAALRLADHAAKADPFALLIPRIALLHAAGRTAEAITLFDRAITTPVLRIAPADIVRIAYELNALPALLAAADRRRITRLPTPVVRDLAAMLVAIDRFDRIPRIDALSAGDWRRLDPWLALQIARKAGDVPAIRHYAALLPRDRVHGVEEAALRAQGDLEGLRRLLLSEPRDPAVTAGLMESAGFPADAERFRRIAAEQAGPADPAAANLLYRWGPRPDATALAWLLTRARKATDPASRLSWLRLYADRDRADHALATLAAERDADTNPVLLLRLKIASEAGRDPQANALIARLIDGRVLDRADLRRIAATMPATAPLASRLALARRMIAAGLGTPQMQLDLGWVAFDSHNFAEARGHIAAYLASHPDDETALTLAGEIEQAAAAPAVARSFFVRALAATPVEPETASARARLLERLGRVRDALALVRAERARPLADPVLKAQEARLLIAVGHPAAAAALLREAAR